MSSSRLSCAARLLLRCIGNVGNSFPRKQGRIPHLEFGGGNGAPLDVAGTLCFLWSGDGCVGELLELQLRCEGTFEVPEVRCD